MPMTIDQIEENLKKLFESKICEETFFFDFLLAYGSPKASVSRLKKGDYNLSTTPGEVFWKKKAFFKIEKNIDLHKLIDELKRDSQITKANPLFIIVTDFKILLSIDTKINDTLDIPIEELPRYFDFFLPLAGMEKAQIQRENLADKKAAEKLARLYDLIIEENSFKNPETIHSLNVFLSRLLFCFFAEDTGIFSENKFTNAVMSHTAENGSDLSDYLSKIFKVLSDKKRSSNIPQFLQSFPYVNGGLFKEKIPVPKFSKKSRKTIIECGSLNWKKINPDIFGSMIQAVVHHGERGSLGIHYTSVENIMKVIRPLFLDDLYNEFEKAGDSKKKLKSLLQRLYNLKIFDPACGSGNFLIIAYKELCKLEMEVFKKLHGQQMRFQFSGINLNQFYGIEIDDFAHETAKLSLYLAEHQMNLEFKKTFGETKPTLPLDKGGNIVCENAARIGWETVCPKDNNSEIYILGNPPYLGAKLQQENHKEDLKTVASGLERFKNLDYISCWFIKATDYILETTNKFSFVSTNSICQGEHVSLLWPPLLKKGIEIEFAHQSFKWTNSAKGNAGITCVVIGIRNLSKNNKYLYENSIKKKVRNINPYLIPREDIIIQKRTNSISQLPEIYFGNMPRDGGYLVLKSDERRTLISSNSQSEKFILKYLGSREFIRGQDRYCLWIEDIYAEEAFNIKEIKERIKKVENFRLKSNALSTKQYAKEPHKFVQISYQKKPSIIIPSVSSERRNYIPIGFLDDKTVVSNSAFAIYDPPHYLFSIISSRMHMTWVRTVAGRLETRYRYSSDLCYNTFPFPEITDRQKNALKERTFEILDEREKHPERTLAELYDPDKMPRGLLEAHQRNDIAIDKCYRKKPFASDEERLEYLFKLYAEMIEKEKNRG